MSPWLLKMLIYLILTIQIFPQDKLDSLDNKITHSIGGKKAQFLNDAAKLILAKNPQKARDYSQKAYNVAMEFNDKPQAALALKNIGVTYYFTQNYDIALDYYNKAINLFEELKEKKQVANLFNNMGIIYEYINDYSKAIEAHRKALSIRLYLGDKNDIAMSYLNLGTVFNSKGEYRNAEKVLLNAKNLAYEVNNKLLIVNSHNNLGVVYKNLSDYSGSIVNYQAVLKIGEQVEDSRTIAGAYSNIGVVYLDWHNYKKAIEYFNFSLKYASQTNDKRAFLKIYGNLGTCYFEMNDMQNALAYNNKALVFIAETNDKQALAITFNVIGSIYRNLNKQDSALTFYKKSYDISKSIEDEKNYALVCYRIAEIYILKNSFTEAEIYANEGLGFAKRNNFKEALKEGYLTVSVIADKKDDYKKSLEAYKLYMGYRDSVFSESNNKIVSELQEKYESEKKQKEIELLTIQKRNQELDIIRQKQQLVLLQKDKTLQSLELSQRLKEIQILEQDRKIQDLELLQNKLDIDKKQKQIQLLDNFKKIKELESERRKVFIYLLVILTIAIVIILAITFNRYSLKKKTNIELERINKKLEESETNLIEANLSKDKFFSIIAHDLRNPVGVLKSLTDMLVNNYDRLDDEKRRKLVTTIGNSFAFTNNLLENLLQWVLTQKEKLDINKTGIDISGLIDSNIKLFKANVQVKELQLLNTIEPRTNIFADINTCDTIFRNLISNAIKFTEKGTITISSKLNDNYCFITVEDTGVGLSKDDIDKLFRLNVKNSEIGNKKEKGTGLGLILCKEFAIANDGDIYVESNLGIGSKFIVKLPIFKEK